ncbi:hypothetical protein TheveDRAFT_0127 [Thermanaerovibrio velox DSM 12556]|uniref:UPF0182 protein TheveDRAFT_0127 n=1 Tax=Thermanaerovibrio velox DSM 12556 TaxID=926567 RepID=H0UN35_9BACT|nr:UPF0182 family protein [Thermanaerovibrio velox]EHM09314.1 hypothetical protein TheveDRAFT_0127 [Thermanaerovibrio velox DSM 12556]
MSFFRFGPFGPFRGFKKNEWIPGDGDNQWSPLEEGGEVFDSRPVRPLKPKGLIPLGLIVGGVVLLLLVPWLFTELWWFRSVGFEEVFIRRILARAGLFALGFLVAALALWRSVGGRKVSSGLLAGVLLGALFKGVQLSSLWLTLLSGVLWSPLGVKDPLFGLDAGFYLFAMPALDGLLKWLWGLWALGVLGSLASMRLDGGLQGLHFRLLSLRWIPSLGLVLWTGSVALDVLSLVWAPGRVVYGASFADVKVRLPLMLLQGTVLAVSAVLLALGRVKPSVKLAKPMVVLFAGLWFLRAFLPGVIQQLVVRPNEFQMERPYIGAHVDMTLKAYGLQDVKTVQVDPAPKVGRADLTDRALKNIRLWDYEPLLTAYKQLQEIRSYYEFLGADVDRYPWEGGRMRQVMLAVRELDHRKLQSQTWVNRHLEFTHGYGLVMNYVNQVAPGGMPDLIIKDIPPSGGPVELKTPAVYYGEMNYPYALVRTKVREFDYPSGDSNVRSVYSGEGGVPVGSWIRRLAFALRFRDMELLFTQALTNDSKIMFNRNIIAMASRVAPFLVYDSDPYPVVHRGRLLWMLDGYLVSRYFPYSRPMDAPLGGGEVRLNYVRNSVKVTVDAFDGEIRFYGTGDPALEPYRRLFPGLFRSLSEMPGELKGHLRYPKDLFAVQAEAFRLYHMGDPNTFYNREDLWQISPPESRRPIRPNYVTMDMGDPGGEEFVLMLPFMPAGRNNLVGWMAARCDGEHYGELVVYKYPKRNLVFGPTQVEALIDQNPEISAQLSLWSQRGSDVIRGDLLVLPMGRSILYVQPVYLKAERGELPELKRVVLSSGGQVVWGETLQEAVGRLVGGERASSSTEDSPPGADGPRSDGGEVKNVLLRAREALKRSREALKLYDFAAYGRAMRDLEEALEEMSRYLSGGDGP